MKIAFGMIVCNGDDYLEACIRQVYSFADQIVVSEGATESWMKAMGWDSPESKDETNAILWRLQREDGGRKIKVIHGGWTDKIQQSNGYMPLIDPSTDYVWQLDSDEFYMRPDLDKVKDYLEKERPTYVDVRQLHFFKNFKTIAVGQTEGWGWETPQPRIQKFYPGCKYIEHRPPMIVDPRTGVGNGDIKRANLTEKTGVVCFHYNYVTNKQVREKMAYYATEFPQVQRLQTWVKDVWEAWDKNRDLVESNFGTHPTAWKGSKTAGYGGPHPEEMEKRINEIVLDNPQ